MIEKQKRAKAFKCMQCDGCVATCKGETDCGVCIDCLDKPIHGGSGVRKRCCIKKQCIMRGRNRNFLIAIQGLLSLNRSRAQPPTSPTSFVPMRPHRGVGGVPPPHTPHPNVQQIGDRIFALLGSPPFYP